MSYACPLPRFGRGIVLSVPATAVRQTVRESERKHDFIPEGA